MSRAVFKEKLKDLRRYKGTERIIERYKELVEKHNGKQKNLAVMSGEALLSIFERNLNPLLKGDDSQNEFHPLLVKNTIHSLDILGRFIGRFPEAVEDYIETIQRIGGLSHQKNKGIYRENVLPMLKTTLDAFDEWELDNRNEVWAKFKILDPSIECCIGMIAALNKQGIFESDDNVVSLYPPRKELIRVYLNRGLTALGEEHDHEKAELIVGMFMAVDDKIKKTIAEGKRSHGTDEVFVGRWIRSNERMAALLGNGEIRFEGVVKALNHGGLEAIERIVDEAEDGFISTY